MGEGTQKREIAEQDTAAFYSKSRQDQKARMQTEGRTGCKCAAPILCGEQKLTVSKVLVPQDGKPKCERPEGKVIN